ncbi:MAG: hypothetical protein AAGI69_01740 [Cyanobacteria bacterium P01_H01_bin.21]
MINADVDAGHSFGVRTNTRNHKGYFVENNTVYQLISVDQSGWAFICQDNSTCHYVDPANLRRIATLAKGT